MYGTAAITLTATDSHQKTISETFAVSVISVNDSPIVSQTLPNINREEDAENYVIDLNAYFYDQDVEAKHDVLRFDADVTNSQIVTANISDNNQLSLNFLPDQFGLVTVSVSGYDNAGSTVAQSFEVEITPINDAPQAQSQEHSILLPEDQTALVDLEGLVYDVDGDVLTYQFYDTENEAWLDIPQANHGLLDIKDHHLS